MKNSIIVFSLSMLLVIGVSACSPAGTVKTASSGGDALQVQDTITVQGTSSITVTPTIAYVNIGVTTFSKEAVIAQSDNAEKMQRVYEVLDGLGIGKDNIKTISYYITPHYDYTYSTAKMTGYDVTNGIQVTVLDLAKVSQVLDMTVEQGINQSNSISFDITEQEKNDFYLQALTQAVANAGGKAGALASAAGVTLGEPAQITESSPDYVVTPGYDASGAGKGEGSVTPISAGELKVEANVTVVYGY
ncbi:SIMPL domain-containing protein [Parasporobacterium paucivorans]|uniref:26 kDa periplasmic immunogenic protein n=1 Tax=Parasporobacterium paucivorans DSM 15970 TaxID=1122934 RepID=A0A1M6JJC1_9FIRM|nr:SIMPL domain-containing protein [Parasporobacterium paucivorans]SHJ46760.1 hypothetical protein SAMN02745691_02015 [Parasporobacterium paucivorans DSM 15970]